MYKALPFLIVNKALKKIINKKKMFFLPFSDRPKISENKVLFFFFWCLILYFSTKCYNKLSKYIVTVPNRYFHEIFWNIQPLLTPESNQFWGSACLRMHTHEWHCISSASRLKTKKQKQKKINLPTKPKGQTNFLFF